MKGQKKLVLLLGIATAAIATAVFLPGVVRAGDLQPSGAPASTMHTLEDIYDKVGTVATTTSLASAGSSGVPMVPGEGTPIYVSIEGENQGLITDGASQTAGREDMVKVVGLGHRVSVPIDATTGLPTGRRTHEPVTLLKYVDKATPKLFQACVTGERLPEVMLRFYRLSPVGAEEHYYTILLENAAIVEIKQGFPNLESVAFTYERITWTWELDGIESQDTWRSVVAK